MSSATTRVTPITMATLPIDDRDLDDDDAFWTVAASLAASYTSPTSTTTSHFRKPLAITNTNFCSPPPPPPPLTSDRPHKILKSSSSCINNAISHSPVVIKQNNSNWPISRLPEIVVKENISPVIVRERNFNGGDDKEMGFRHCLSGGFPTVSLFRDYQDAAMAVLDKSDYTLISGSPYIKKSGWRKIAFYFNVSFEIKDKTIEFDETRNVQRAEFVVRAHMQGGRFSDGWGSCERREKRFLKPNNDIPSTAETRAKNRACQDLIGVGQYRHGANTTR